MQIKVSLLVKWPWCCGPMPETRSSMSGDLGASLPDAVKIPNSFKPLILSLPPKNILTLVRLPLGGSANLKYSGFCNDKFLQLMSELAYDLEQTLCSALRSPCSNSRNLKEEIPD